MIKSLCGITDVHRLRESMVQDIVELEGGDHSIKTDCLKLQVLESDRLSRKCGPEIEL